MAEDLTSGAHEDVQLNESLSPRERQLMVMAARGLTDQGIAHELGISTATVATYWGRVRIKFGPLPRAELIGHFIRGEMARAGDAIARNEATLRTLLESTPLGVILADPEGMILYVNAAYESISGRAQEDLVGHPAINVVHPDDRSRVMDAWTRAIEAGVTYTAEYRYARPDGVRWVRSRGNVWSHDGMVGGRVGIIEDVTEMREAEAARAEAEERYRTLLALAPEAIVTVDGEQRIVEFNSSAERMFGYEAGEAIGKPLAMLIPPASRVPHEAFVEAFGQGQTSAARPMGARADVRGLRKSGEEFLCEASIIRQTLRGRTLFTAIVRDVSDRAGFSPREAQHTA